MMALLHRASVGFCFRWATCRSFISSKPGVQRHVIPALAARRCFRANVRRNHDKIIASGCPQIELVEDKSIPMFLFDKFEEFGNKTAIIDGLSRQQYSYPQLRELVFKCGSALTKLGFKKGDVFAIHCTNVIEYPVILLAVLSLGGIATTLSSMASVSEICYQLKNTQAQYIVTSAALATNAKEAAKQCGLSDIFVVGEAEGCRPISTLFKDDGESFPKDIKINPKEDVALLPFSSGTTGLPKGVMLTHFNITSNLQQFFAGFYECSMDDNVLGLAPFFHILGLTIVLGGSLYCGATVVTLPKFEPSIFLETMQNFKISSFFTVPPIILFLAKSPLVDNYDLSSLRALRSGAAPLSQDVEILVSKRLNNAEFRQGYGLTESSPAACSIPLGEFRPGSCGKVLPNTAFKVQDLTTGELLGPNEEGEICIRGPQIMKGYLNNPEATRATIDSNGWLRTGDIGYYDEDKYFYVVDRCKELIKYKGYQVAPAELEAVLVSHPKIQDAAVIGVPCEELGELPKAFIVAKDVTVDEVNCYVENIVAPYKRLRGGIEYIDEVPKSLSGKILRKVLKEKEMSK